MIETEKQKVIEAVVPELLSLAAIKESNKFIFQVINYANAKQRKAILKPFKDQTVALLNAENPKAYLIIQKLLETVDDTKMLEKHILKELKDQMPDVVKNPNGILLLQALFAPKQ